MAGDEQRHELVAQRGVAHRRAVLVARLEQPGQDVVALGEVVGVAMRVDLLLDERVDGREHPLRRPDADRVVVADERDGGERDRAR